MINFQRFTGMLRNNLLSNSEQIVWHSCLFLVIVVCYVAPVAGHLYYSSYYEHPSYTSSNPIHSVISEGKEVCGSDRVHFYMKLWDFSAIILSLLLTVIYYWQTFFGSKIIPFEREKLGAMALIAVVSLVALLSALLSVHKGEHLLMLTFLLTSTVCYLALDGMVLGTIRGAASSSAPSLDLSGLRKEERRFKLSIWLANIPTSVGLLFVLIYVLIHESLGHEQTAPVAQFVGGAAAMHVLYGDLVVGVIMREEP